VEVVMRIIRKANDRGSAHYGWLDSRHTFSFGHYYDPLHMGFSALRVINDDRISAGMGFDTHGHRDMEIISFVMEGALEHKDSEGNRHILSAGEFQLMSAGKGIYHSEYNASKTDDARFLQIWIQPDTIGNEPGYQQNDFGKQTGLTLIASPSGDIEGKGVFHIKQNTKLYQLILESNTELYFAIKAGRKLYVHQLSGQLGLDDMELTAGDGGKVELSGNVLFANRSNKKVMALVFDLP